MNWYHVKCGDISDTVYQNIAEIVWFCEKYVSRKENEAEPQDVKLFLRYVDNIVGVINPEKVIQTVKSFHSQLQFTIEAQNAAGYLVILDSEINIDNDRRLSCGLYQKPTDTIHRGN